jgi:hypothetical protein
MTSQSHGVPPRGIPRRLAAARAAARLLTAGAAASSCALRRCATAGAALGVRTAGLRLRSGTAVGAIGATGVLLGVGHGDFLSSCGARLDCLPTRQDEILGPRMQRAFRWVPIIEACSRGLSVVSSSSPFKRPRVPPEEAGRTPLQIGCDLDRPGVTVAMNDRRKGLSTGLMPDW